MITMLPSRQQVIKVNCIYVNEILNEFDFMKRNSTWEEEKNKQLQLWLWKDESNEIGKKTLMNEYAISKKTRNIELLGVRFVVL